MRPLLSISLLSLVLLAACGKEAPTARKGAPAVAVSTARAEVAPLSLRTRAWGEVESSVAPEVAAESSGRVLRVLAEAGQAVKAGQVLAEVDPGTAGDAHLAAQAEAARIGALLAEQRATVRRNQALVAQGFISAAALEASTAQLSALEKQLSAAQAVASSKGRDAARTVIRAPVAGVIEARAINAGDYVTPGKVVFSINAAGSRRVRLALGGADGDKLARGMELVVSGNGQRASSRISEVRAGLDPASRARIAWADLPADAPWRVGDALDADVLLAQRDALSVPQAAVVERPAGKVVYLIAGNKAAERKVTTGVSSDGRIEILSGLKPGDTVAVDGAGFLADGAEVRLAAAKGAKAAGKGAGV